MNYALDGLIFVVALVVYAAPPLQGISRAAARMAARMGRHRLSSLLLVFLIALVSMALPSVVGTLPVPLIHDEFGYLLAADTFAHGRLTNPTHELWQHFETFHVIHRPTYMSKFPPGQGLALAVGQLLGHPLIGAWLSVALACAATTWMLRAWVRPRWALLGGLIAAFSLAAHWWSQIYWGGGVAFLGGALVGGGAVRSMKRPNASLSAIIALGIAILANSRPFEGMLLCVVVLPVLAIVIVRKHGWWAVMLKVAAPAAAVLLPCAAGMMYYNWRITHDPFLMPYMLHQKQYMIAPLMRWQKPNPMPQYRHDLLRRFHLYDELPVYEKQQTLRGFVESMQEQLAMLWRWYLRPLPILIPLFASLFALRRRANWLALLVCVWLPAAHIIMTPWMRVQYMAPALPFLIALLVVGLQRLEKLHFKGLRFGPPLIGAVLLTQLCTFVWFAVRQNRPAAGRQRAEFIEMVSELPGKHLAILRYSAHPAPAEWVFNEADIDASRVVFARAMNPEGDLALLEYFQNRTIWLIDVDGPAAYVRRLARP